MSSLFHKPTKGQLTLLFSGALMLSLMGFRAIDDSDIFWQLKIGQLFLNQGKFVTTEHFSYLHFGQHSANPYWLAQVLFCLIYQLGGWSALRWFHNIIFVLPFLIAAASPSSGEKTFGPTPALFSITAAVMLGFLSSLGGGNLRPQEFALLSFSLSMYILRSEQLTLVKVLMCAVLGVIWQNCHPSIILGVLAALLTVIQQLLERKHFWRQNTFWGLVLVLFLSAAQFAGPEGWRIIATARANLNISRYVLHIWEWQPPWDISAIKYIYLYWLALLITVLSISRINPGMFALGKDSLVKFIGANNLVFIIPYTALTLYAARFAPFWAIVMIPFWISFFEQLRPRWLVSSPSSSKASANLCIRVTAASISLILFSVIFSPSSEKILQAGIPLSAIEFLKKKVPAGRIYNDRDWGGALMFYGYPQWQVTIDGRLYLYSEQEWREYYQAALGQLDLEELVNKHQPQAFFVHKGFHEGLVRLLDHSPAWEEAFSQDQCVIFLPRNPPKQLF